MRLMLDTYHSPLGEILLVSDSDGALRALDFADYEQRLRRLLRLHYGTYELDLAPAPVAVVNALAAYFAGDLDAVSKLRVATGGTPFQRKVWAALRRIPAGRTHDLRRARSRALTPRSKPRGWPRQRVEPDRHRCSLPSRDREKRHADRICRRPATQALAAGA